MRIRTGRLVQQFTFKLGSLVHLSPFASVANGDFVYISPEIIEPTSVLNALDINSDQLICLAILVGTDFNPGGVKGLGPKKALTLVKQFKQPVAIFQSLEGRVVFDWKEIFEIFKKPNVSSVRIEFPKANFARVEEILVKEHDFSLERVQKQLEKLREIKKGEGQKRLF